MLLILLGAPLQSAAEESAEDKPATAAPEAVPDTLRSPRATLGTFLHAMNDIKRGQPERIEAFCEGIRELVRQPPYMHKDNFHVYLNGLGASSLGVPVYVFWETPDWDTELRERHRLLLDCLRLAQCLEVEYAFPTQTLYLRQEQPAEAAEGPALDKAGKLGREQAKAIVSETTGLGVRPPPVSFD